MFGGSKIPFRVRKISKTQRQASGWGLRVVTGLRELFVTIGFYFRLYIVLLVVHATLVVSSLSCQGATIGVLSIRDELYPCNQPFITESGLARTLLAKFAATGGLTLALRWPYARRWRRPRPNCENPAKIRQNLGKNWAKIGQNLAKICQIQRNLAKKLPKISAIFDEIFEH